MKVSNGPLGTAEGGDVPRVPDSTGRADTEVVVTNKTASRISTRIDVVRDTCLV